MKCNRARLVSLVGALGVCVSGAQAQSLFQQPVAPPPPRGAHQATQDAVDPQASTGQGAPAVAAEPAPAAVVTRDPASQPIPLESVSLMSVKPAKPTEYLENDLVTIIISERSKMDRSQEAESKKDYTNDFTVKEFMDLMSLLELQVEKTSAARLPGLNVESTSDFKGDGSYKREDKFTDRITARVLEVKPNGTMLIEARRQFKTDEEETVVLLSGICRVEDISSQNTIQSNQLFDLVMDVQNSGDLKRTSRKGLIPRILEGLLNF
jgi:flagellar L-ring protein precursor FlgH